MPKSKEPVRTSVLRVDAYKVLVQAIEDGVNLGWSRAHKHNDRPGEATIKESMRNEIMNSICEWFNFDEENDEG